MHVPVRSAFIAPLLVSVALAGTAGLAAARDENENRVVQIQSISVKTANTVNPLSFDISWVDNATGKYFLADRTNNAVDLFDARHDTFTGPIGQGVFTGAVPAAKCPTGGNTCSGPDGVLTDTAGLVWAGDGDSTIKVLRPTPNTGKAALIKSIKTDPNGKARADELSFDPGDQRILIANDAEGFLTFIDVAHQSVATNFYYADNTVGRKATLAGLSTPGGGIEQSVFVPKTGLFYQALPADSPRTVGVIDVFTPAGKFVTRFNIPGCENGPSGLAFDGEERFLGACDNGAAVIDLKGRVRRIIANVGGADEVWFNPGDENFYLGISGPPGRLGVVHDEKGFVVTGPNGASVGGHSVAAFAGNNHIFAPDRTATRGIDVFQSREDDD